MHPARGRIVAQNAEWVDVDQIQIRQDFAIIRSFSACEARHRRKSKIGNRLRLGSRQVVSQCWLCIFLFKNSCGSMIDQLQSRSSILLTLYLHPADLPPFTLSGFYLLVWFLQVLNRFVAAPSPNDPPWLVSFYQRSTFHDDVLDIYWRFIFYSFLSAMLFLNPHTLMKMHVTLSAS